MTKLPALRLYQGQTTHIRFKPFERRFSYKITLIDIDIDRLDEAKQASWLFSVDRRNMFNFRRSDHGPRKNAPLRPWAEAELTKAGVTLDGGPIRLVTFARGLFYKFAPLSVWYGYGPDEQLRGVIYEVNNTFGETHNYVAASPHARSQHESDKAFHVSPFWDVTGRYKFTLRPPGNTLDLVIDSLVDGERLHMANIKAQEHPATTARFMRTALLRPFAAMGVTLGIHWEALHLWRRGAGYRSKPKPPEHRTTIATTTSPTGDNQERAA